MGEGGEGRAGDVLAGVRSWSRAVGVAKVLFMGDPLLVLVGIIISATGPRLDGGAIFPVATGYVHAKVGLRGILQVESAPTMTTHREIIIFPVLVFRTITLPETYGGACCLQSGIL